MYENIKNVECQNIWNIVYQTILVVYSLRIASKIVNDMVGNLNPFLLTPDFIDLSKRS